MCKRHFLDIDILEPTCQLSLGQERSGEQHRKNTESLTTYAHTCLCVFLRYEVEEGLRYPSLILREIHMCNMYGT